MISRALAALLLVHLVGCRHDGTPDVPAPTSSEAKSAELADGWYECERCGITITSHDGEINWQISTPQAKACIHKWKESEGADIDPLPDAIP
jgi:hypothetical protein